MVTILGFVGYFILISIIYYIGDRIITQYYTMWYYKRQGVAMFGGVVPFIGHFIRLIRLIKKYKDTPRGGDIPP